jgi:(p)ppGpp synthase/HD superfamily hydrolase
MTDSGFTTRFEHAFVYANQVHGGQTRKGQCTPYITHLMSVAALVIEDGGNEDEAIAALLHDAVEDQGGRPRLDDIRRRFGDQVATIVDGCSETLEREKADWATRKTAYIEHLRAASPAVLRVAAADKLHNARSLLMDHRKVNGNEMFDRFTGKVDGTLWYYQTLATIFADASPGFLADELRRVVGKLTERAKEAR